MGHDKRVTHTAGRLGEPFKEGEKKGFRSQTDRSTDRVLPMLLHFGTR